MIRKETLFSETRKAIRSLIATLTIMIIVLSVVYLAATNETAQKGYTLQQAKLKNEVLKTENSVLNTKITQSKAFSEIEEDDKISTMQEIEEKKYVTNEDNSVY